MFLSFQPVDFEETPNLNLGVVVWPFKPAVKLVSVSKNPEETPLMEVIAGTLGSLQDTFGKINFSY